jgi:alkanesulfonate monooxygenase SsuD/methylene tetrahydromethanopterin reductase-like flavin-dependent oxidoreductase (luciferase family)
VPPNVVAAARQSEDLGFESVWLIDQLVPGTGLSPLDSVVVLAAAAAATERVKLGFGVMVLALRPAVWVAKQIASLQHLSGDRVLLGVGVGAHRHPGSWVAAGVPQRERGRLTDSALRVLPDMISGALSQAPDGSEFRLRPGATVPPILVGGTTKAALARAAEADGWFAVPLSPAEVVRLRSCLAELAAARGRPEPATTIFVLAALSGDPTVPERSNVLKEVCNPKSMHSVTADEADAIVVTGPPAALAERLSALRQAGAERLIVHQAGGEWSRQAELVAEAVRMVY